jgi:lambda family phage portal protein
MMSLRRRLGEWALGAFKSPVSRMAQWTGETVVVMKRFFAAAKTTDGTLRWGKGLRHIDHVLASQLPTLVQRSREAAVNSGYISKYLAEQVRNVVGPTGVTLQVLAENRGLCEAVEAAFRRWQRRADTLNRHHFRELQALVLRSVLTDGEAFVLLRSEPAGFSVQLLDAQRVPPALNHQFKDGRSVVNGIEYDALGRPAAYYHTKADTPDAAYTQWGGIESYLRLPAADVLHVFSPVYVAQKRGIPATATALTLLYKMDQYTSSVLANARTSANQALLLKSEMPLDHTPSDSYVREGEAPKNKPLHMSEEGEIMVLPEGMTAISHTPRFPTGEFAPFKKALLQEVASGVDMNYASLASDGEGVNFSTLRHFTLNERDGFKMKQQMLIDQFLTPVYEAWLKDALLRGTVLFEQRPVPGGRYEELLETQWQGCRWSWVDPMKDALATSEQLRSLTKSFSDAAREAGKDPAELFKQIARDIEAMKAAGIPEALIMGFYSTATPVLGELFGGDTGGPNGGR